MCQLKQKMLELYQTINNFFQEMVSCGYGEYQKYMFWV